MKVIVQEPPNTLPLRLRCLSPVVLICLTLPPAFSVCRNNPNPQSKTTRISRLNDAPETIRDLAEVIQGKSPAHIREIIVHRYGPSRHIGSGLDIESWNVAGGNVVFHPVMGPVFDPKRGKRIWLLITTNKALPNILGSYEMYSPRDRDGIESWLGNVRLDQDRAYMFKDSDAFPGLWATQTDNFFKLHPSGIFKIEFAAGCTGETLLEGLPDNTVLGRLIFATNGGAQPSPYSIVTTENRGLVLRSNHARAVRIYKSWHEFWQ